MNNKDYAKKWRKANPDYMKKYSQDNKQELSVKQKSRYNQNPQKYKNKQKEWRINNLLKTKETKLRLMYGISLEQYDQMVKDQNGLCKICGKTETVIDKRTGKIRALAVDHNHVTNKVRGLLCSKHNTGLGKFNDSVEELEKAINYIKSFEAS